MVKVLDEQEAEEQLRTLQGWSIEDGRLVRTYTFDDFDQAIHFVNQVAAKAERYEHHPDVHIHYNEVTLELWTHEEDGLTEWDFELADLISGVEGWDPGVGVK